MVGGISEAVEVDGVLCGQRRRCALGEAVMVEGEAVEAIVCAGGGAVKGALRRRRCAPGVDGVEACSINGRGGGSVEDLKCASGENLLSVEWATCAPDIYIGGQMHDTCSVRHVAHFFR
jgi:hypothetical protein